MKRYLIIDVTASLALLLSSNWALAQKDPGVRGGIQNTGGGLQQQGIPIPHPPVISPNPTTGNHQRERTGLLRGRDSASRPLESTCDDCADVTDGSPVRTWANLTRCFPSSIPIPTAWGARHNADQCFSCHAQPSSVGRGDSWFRIPATRLRSQRRTRNSA